MSEVNTITLNRTTMQFIASLASLTIAILLLPSVLASRLIMTIRYLSPDNALVSTRAFASIPEWKVSFLVFNLQQISNGKFKATRPRPGLCDIHNIHAEGGPETVDRLVSEILEYVRRLPPPGQDGPQMVY